MESNLEIWKDIPEYEGMYQCSSFGQVRSLDRIDCRNRRINGTTMKQNKCSTGYIAISLWKNGIRKDIKAHQLVAMCFFNHTQCGYSLVVNHKNGNRIDNNVENLEVVTARYNSQHSSQMRVDSKSSIYTGVVYREKLNTYQVAITINGERIYIGAYKDELEASDVYLSAVSAHEKGLFEQFYNLIIEKRLSKQTSRYEGICFHKCSKKWKARVNVNGSRVHVGSFKTEQEAHLARLNYIACNMGTSLQRSPG